MKKIELKNCNKKYHKNNKEIEILNNLSYEFNDGKFYAIMGESGSGKSTLFNLIAGLIKLDNGKILINNKDISKMNNKEISDIRNKEIGIIYQAFLLNEEMTALENVLLPTYINKNISYEESKEKGIKLLTELGLEERINHYPKELSGGEQQRVAIARALINDPGIILADEPTGNLDQKNEKEIFNILENLSKKGKCVIVVSHNLLITNYAGITLKLERGTLNEKK